MRRSGRASSPPTNCSSGSTNGASGRSDQETASVAEAVRAVQTANPQWSDEQRRHMAWHVELWSRDDCAAGSDALSARYWDEGYELYGDGDSIFWNGYQSLVEKLAKGLKVRLGCPVTHISHDGRRRERRTAANSRKGS